MTVILDYLDDPTYAREPQGPIREHRRVFEEVLDIQVTAHAVTIHYGMDYPAKIEVDRIVNMEISELSATALRSIGVLKPLQSDVSN